MMARELVDKRPGDNRRLISDCGRSNEPEHKVPNSTNTTKDNGPSWSVEQLIYFSFSQFLIGCGESLSQNLRDDTEGDM